MWSYIHFEPNWSCKALHNNSSGGIRLEWWWKRKPEQGIGHVEMYLLANFSGPTISPDCRMLDLNKNSAMIIVHMHEHESVYLERSAPVENPPKVISSLLATHIGVPHRCELVGDCVLRFRLVFPSLKASRLTQRMSQHTIVFLQGFMG